MNVRTTLNRRLIVFTLSARVPPAIVAACRSRELASAASANLRGTMIALIHARFRFQATGQMAAGLVGLLNARRHIPIQRWLPAFSANPTVPLVVASPLQHNRIVLELSPYARLRLHAQRALRRVRAFRVLVSASCTAHAQRASKLGPSPFAPVSMAHNTSVEGTLFHSRCAAMKKSPSPLR